MEFKTIRTGESTYEIAFDDNCLVVRSGGIALNFATRTDVEIVLV